MTSSVFFVSNILGKITLQTSRSATVQQSVLDKNPQLSLSQIPERCGIYVSQFMMVTRGYLWRPESWHCKRRVSAAKFMVSWCPNQSKKQRTCTIIKQQIRKNKHIRREGRKERERERQTERGPIISIKVGAGNSRIFRFRGSSPPDTGKWCLWCNETMQTELALAYLDQLIN